jgi:hypothetical protein
MSFSVTCRCGARLEIDERFAGQAIACPDCQTALSCPAPEPTPHPRLSGLAVASLIVALVGAFTLVGGVAALVLGFVARRRIERQPHRFTGVRYARAAMLVGGAGTLLTGAALAAPSVLHLDVLLREFEWAGRLDYTSAEAPSPVLRKPISFRGDISLTLPSSLWGECQLKDVRRERSDSLLLVNIWEDAQLGCQTIELGGDERDWESARGKALERFYKSDLVNLVGRLHGKPLPKEGTPRDIKSIAGGMQEMMVDLRLGGIERTFLLRLSKSDSYLDVLVGGTRKQRFGPMQEQFRKTFDTFKIAQ